MPITNVGGGKGSEVERSTLCWRDSRYYTCGGKRILLAEQRWSFYLFAGEEILSDNMEGFDEKNGMSREKGGVEKKVRA